MTGANVFFKGLWKYSELKEKEKLLWFQFMQKLHNPNNVMFNGMSINEILCYYDY